MEHFYKVEDDSPAAEAIQQILADRTAMFILVEALVERLGAKSAIWKHSIVGFIFEDGKAPEGWKNKGKVSGQSFYAPEKRKKADRELWKEFGSFSRDAFRDAINTLLTGSGWGVMNGMKIRSCMMEKIGGVRVVGIPTGENDKPGHKENNHTLPDGITPLKTSEYYALKESAEDLEKAVA